MEGLWPLAAFRSAGACWWLQRDPLRALYLVPRLRSTWLRHLGFSFARLGRLGISLCPSSSSDFSLPACGGPSHFPGLQPAPCSSSTHLLRSLNRRQRLAATQTLNTQWQETPRPVVWEPVLRWRRLPVHWHRRTACSRPQPRQAWAGWPQRGRRIGEAQNPWHTCGAGKATISPVTTSTRVLSGSTLLAPCNGMCQLPGSIPTAALAVLFAVSMSPKPTGSTHAAIPMDTDGLQLLYIPFSHPSCQDCHPAACPYSAARHAWAQVLTRACATVAHRNDRKAWHELCMLPKCVLCTPTRGGRQHRKATGTHLGPLAPLAGGGTAIPLGLPYCVAAGAWTA